MAKPLLSKSVLNQINRTLYGSGASVEFFKVTPSAGETTLGTITSGFTVTREEPRAGRDGSGVNLRLSADAGITRERLNQSSMVAITIDGHTTKYTKDQLLPQQQIGAGYVMRLLPHRGATA